MNWRAIRFRADSRTRTTHPGPNAGRSHGRPTLTAASESKGSYPRRCSPGCNFRHPDFADDDLFVSTGLPLPDWLDAFNVKPVDARFTHTLEPARPVTGVVTDKETGQPLAGVLVQMIPSRNTNRYGGDVSVFATTDASGRFRAAGAAGETFWVTACPDAGSGYLPLLTRDNRWPVGAKVLSVNLSLPKGRVIRGRVVEGQEGQPVAAASVIYQPGPDNSLDRGDYDFDNPILTDKNGQFALTALPGPGLLAVEGPTSDYIRVALTGLAAGTPRVLARMRLRASMCRQRRTRRSPMQGSRFARG